MDEDVNYYLENNELKIEINSQGERIIIEPSKFYDDNNMIELEDNNYMKEKSIKVLPSRGTSSQLQIKEKIFSFFIVPIKISIEKYDEIYYIYNKEHFLKLLEVYPDKFKYYKYDSNDDWRKFNNNLLDNPSFIRSLIFTDDISFEKYETFYDESKERYDSHKEKHKEFLFLKVIDPLILSINFLKYFPTDKENNKNENIDIIMSNERQDFLNDIYYTFSSIENNDEYIFKAYTGPYGIGKSFTVLMLQKMLYFSGHKTLYINLKYYNNTNDSFLDKLETLWKEAFYLFFDKKQYINFLKNRIDSYKSYFDAIKKIIELLNENKEKYLIIFDQYQEKYDNSKKLDYFRKECKNILLISSINDKDVKLNIKKELNGEDKKSKYISYKYLFKLIISKKDINNLNDVKKNIMKDFGYLPIYQNKLKRVYDSNYMNFYQTEIRKIFLYIDRFFINNKRSYLNNLIDNKEINLSDSLNQKSISFSDFINNIDLIPLKYINYIINMKEKKIKLYYAFPFIEKILKEYFVYYDNLSLFNKTTNKGELGNCFESILSYDFKIYKYFSIDAIMEVDKIIEMDFSQITIDFKEYYPKKNRIFITQKNFGGDYFDMGIILPKEKVLILIQAKYRITDKILDKKTYSQKANEIKNKIIAFGLNVESIHFLFLSSINYNLTNAFQIINKKQIDCYFYCPKDKTFFRDLYKEYSIEEFSLNERTKLSGKFINSQILYDHNEFFSLNKISKEVINEFELKCLSQIRNNKIDDDLLNKQYQQFLEYIKNNHFLENKGKNLGIFLLLGQKYPFGIYQLNSIKYYLFICKIDKDNNINFKEQSYIIYSEKINNFIIDLKTGKRTNKEKLDNDVKSNNYSFFQGYWNNN